MHNAAALDSDGVRARPRLVEDVTASADASPRVDLVAPSTSPTVNIRIIGPTSMLRAK